MIDDDEGAAPVRAELDALAAGAPPVGFTAGDVLARGRRTRRLRHGAAVGGTAAALALVVAVPAVALRGPDQPGTLAGSSRTPTAAPTAAPSPTAAPAPQVPGLSPAAAERAARACALSFGGADGRSGDPNRNPPVSPSAGAPTPTEAPSRVPTPPGGPSPSATAVPTPDDADLTPTPVATLPGDQGPAVTPTEPVPSASPRGWDGDGDAPRLQDVVHVHNRVVDAAGEHLLVYGPWDQLSCDREGTSYNAGGASGLDTGWLPGPVAVDAMAAAPGGVRHSGANAPSGPGYVLVEGRVSRQVARLTVTVGGDTAQARPLNGTFLVRFVKSRTWRADDVGELAVTAYDRSGQVVPGTSITTKRGCWVDPAGRVVIGDRANSPTPCTPATPWH